jgi:hypothetical protein
VYYANHKAKFLPNNLVQKPAWMLLSAVLTLAFVWPGRPALATSAGVNFGVARLGSLTTFRPHFVPGDFDGDGKTDVAVYRRGNGYWYALNSSNGAFVFQLMDGPNPVVPVPADYDGDGKADFAIYTADSALPPQGHWRVLNSSTHSPITFVSPVGLPFPRDFNGNGQAEGTVFNPITGVWTSIIREPPNPTTIRQQQFGAPGDLAVPGDYDGDGQTDIAVFRTSTGDWYILRSSNGTVAAVNWGVGSDQTVPGDYDGDGTTDVAVWRPSDGVWYVRRSSDGAFQFQPWGGGSWGDIAVPGDYDGDGMFDFAVFRAGTWYWLRSSDGVLGTIQFGQTGDIPAPAMYIPNIP